MPSLFLPPSLLPPSSPSVPQIKLDGDFMVDSPSGSDTQSPYYVVPQHSDPGPFISTAQTAAGATPLYNKDTFSFPKNSSSIQFNP